MTAPRYLQIHQPDDALLAREASEGLLQPVATLSPKFLYDPLGSRLFEAITVLEEYYLTRTEAQIVHALRDPMARAVHEVLPEVSALVDLGAGNGAKAAAWFDTLRPQRYVAVDISVDYLRESIEEQARRHPGIAMTGIGLDFSSRLAFPEGELPDRCLMHYPGSSIGNFAPEEARRLLTDARVAARGGALLIGVDLVKSADWLVPAYDDVLGVTAAFNLNLLRHLNRLLGADFDPRDWMHVALYSHSRARIEMHLQARRAVTVRWTGHQRHFESGERIHTENSYKWTLDGFSALLRSAGYQKIQSWCDPRQWFAVFLASG
jgi:L-histidine N-alpha-methyltransferase